ncbi:Hyaluronidase OS=Streptomyces alboniger OX=132473 GN=CP975_12090 PE=4 SV=1 [Streptomyces alboniger]
MQLGRRQGAAAIAVAVIAGALGGAPGALAAPGVPGPPAASPDGGDRAARPTPPSVWPRPQTMAAAGSAVTVGDDVVLVTADGTGADSDPYALDALRELLRDAGARRVTEVGDGDPLPAGGTLVVRAGGPGADRALRSLGARDRADLPSGGYRLAVGRVGGRATVALDGTGGDGLFHGVQTLRQLTAVKTRTIPGVLIRDWPGTAVRGLTEGFYGTPWTRAQRLAQLDFLGRTKQNRYLYAPGDDLYRQARWREPYPAGQRADFRALAERARANHVTLAWAVAPGQAMCMSSDRDVKDLTRKIDAMWALGVRAFQLQFQDVSYSEWHCERDAETFGRGPEAAAKAQARVANAVAAHLAGRHPGGEPLSLMPTEYFQKGTTEYRAALSDDLDHRVQVAWTGVGVVPKTITGRELAGARTAFGPHPLVTMDNYPVNDFAQDRVFLGPYTGREPAVATGSAALLGNAMEQPSASRIPLFTAADYAWNPRAYRPHESWLAAIDDLAGGDAKARGALRALAGNEASSVLGADESAYLRPLLRELWQARTTTDRARIEDSAKALRAAFGVMREAPRRLAGTAVDDEVRPWIERLGTYGEAGEAAVDMLRAQSAGDGAAAWRASRRLTELREELKGGRVTVGEGVLDPFLARAQKAYATWAGTGSERASDRATARFGRTHTLAAVTALTDPGTEGSLEAHVPGEGWRRIGTLSTSGFTEVDLAEKGTGRGTAAGEGAGEAVRADAVRVALTDGTVRHLVPWYADAPEARLSLARTEADRRSAAAPGASRPGCSPSAPAMCAGKVTVKAPKGIQVRVPEESTLPRGTRAGGAGRHQPGPAARARPASRRRGRPSAHGDPHGLRSAPTRYGGPAASATRAARASPPARRRRTARAPSGATTAIPGPAASSPVEDGACGSVTRQEPVSTARWRCAGRTRTPPRYRVTRSRPRSPRSARPWRRTSRGTTRLCGRGGGPGPGQRAARLDGGPCLGQDDAGPVAGRRTRTPLADQAGLRRGGHPHRGRPRRPGPGGPRRPLGRHGAPFRLRLDDVPPVTGDSADNTAAEPQQVRVSAPRPSGVPCRG